MINTYDIDGVINLGNYDGLVPRKNDIIITGRSSDEAMYTYKFLRDRQIYNVVHFQNVRFDKKTREGSGWHKANTINDLIKWGVEIGVHFEDDPVQADIIEANTPVKVVRIVHDLVEKENVWHGPADDETSPGTE
jgi:hypothetical protein